MNINFIKYNELIDDSKILSQKIPRNYDVIVAIPRSGLIPASIIGFQHNIPVITVNEFINNIINGHGNRLKRNFKGIINKILLVDDTTSTGNAMNEAVNKIKPVCSKNNIEFETCTIYSLHSSKNINFTHKIINNPRLFEWNIFNSGHLLTACVDIDGVLCEDPNFIESGDNFRPHVINAKPKYLLGRPTLALITNRLEKYREETKIWLKKHNIEYKHLIMSNFKTPEERRINASKFGYGHMKAQKMKELGGQWFIESSIQQAKQIKNITNVSVLCTDNMIML